MICYRHVLQLPCKHDRVVEPESIKRYCFFIYSLIELFVCFNLFIILFIGKSGVKDALR